MSFRKAVFWIHLLCGIVAGLVIAVMTFTGVALAFEKPVLALVERDAAQVPAPPASTTAQPLAAIVRAVRDAQPDARVSGITIQNDPAAAVLVSIGRSDGYYVDPYTGTISGTLSARWRGFFHTMEDWHRALGRAGDHRAAGRAVTGACNAAFLVLAVTGLYLWWPARVGRLRWQLGGKARDWNWHNAVGAWCSPVLVVLTFTGLVMSYRWANNLVFTLSGSNAPVAAGEGPPRTAPEGRPTGAGDRNSGSGAPRTKLDYDAIARAAVQQIPEWGSLTIRLGGPRGSPGGAADGISVAVRPRGAWPLFATTQLTLDPATGAVLRTDPFANANAGRKIRTWIRFLHTGEAFGWPGQALAALATAGGLLLVFTGLSLAYRRFFAR